MANIKSSKKDSITSKKKSMRNSSRKSMLRTFMKKTYFFIHNKDISNAKIIFIKLQRILDRFSGKGVIHKNKAARYKSKLYNCIKKIS